MRKTRKLESASQYEIPMPVATPPRTLACSARCESYASFNWPAWLGAHAVAVRTLENCGWSTAYRKVARAVNKTPPGYAAASSKESRRQGTRPSKLRSVRKGWDYLARRLDLHCAGGRRARRPRAELSQFAPVPQGRPRPPPYAELSQFAPVPQGRPRPPPYAELPRSIPQSVHQQGAGDASQRQAARP